MPQRPPEPLLGTILADLGWIVTYFAMAFGMKFASQFAALQIAAPPKLPQRPPEALPGTILGDVGWIVT